MSDQTLIRVTPAHIVHGWRRDCEKCPIALAVLEAIADPAATVEVGEDAIDLNLPGEWRQADTPRVAADFIYAFDELEDSYGPIEFTLTWRVMETEPLS